MKRTILAASMLVWLPTHAKQDPIVVGAIVVQSAGPGAVATQTVQAAAVAIDAWNARGGFDGVPVSLSVERCSDKKSVVAAVKKLETAGAVALIAPLDPTLAEAVQRTAEAASIGCVRFANSTEQFLGVLHPLFEHNWRTTRVGVVRDGSRPSREFAKHLAKGGLRAPHELVLELELRIKPKKLQKELEKVRPDVLIADGEPAEVAEFLSTKWATTKIPVVLTPRAFGREIVDASIEVWAVLGQSPATRSGVTPFRTEFEKRHGVPSYGAAEGFEAIEFVRRAIETVGKADRAALAKTIPTMTAEGARGRVQFDSELDAAAAPLATWRITRDGQLSPYIPAIVPLEVADSGTKQERKPDPELGEPLGTWRTSQFQQEDGSQWVVCEWAGPETGKATIDDDLEKLGLSTRGAAPLVDHIIKDEIMARVLAITSTKFGRGDDGTGIAGKSLKISFATSAPEKKRRMWPARFGGDDDGAGGRAFGTYCEIYSTFIRRTIFQPHALTPPVTADDLTYLDGTYRFGTDHKLDKRSELIRALINGYAGSMGLTTAHEVGHLCGLGHITDDPHGIMNVAEGGGIDYRDGNFSTGSWSKLVETLGLVGETQRGRRR